MPKVPFFSSSSPRTALISGGVDRPPSQLWEPTAMPCPSRVESFLLLPQSRGGLLIPDPFGLPQRIITHQHFRHTWLTEVSGVGHWEGVISSPWCFCFGQGPCLWLYLVGGMNKGHRLQHVRSSFLSFSPGPCRGCEPGVPSLQVAGQASPLSAKAGLPGRRVQSWRQA